MSAPKTAGEAAFLAIHLACEYDAETTAKIWARQTSRARDPWEAAARAAIAFDRAQHDAVSPLEGRVGGFLDLVPRGKP